MHVNISVVKIMFIRRYKLLHLYRPINQKLAPLITPIYKRNEMYRNEMLKTKQTHMVLLFADF